MAAAAFGDFDDEPEVAADQPLRCAAITVLAPSLGEQIFFFGLQHRELPNLPKIRRETVKRTRC